MVARTPEEQQKILEVLKQEGLEEFFKDVATAYDHNAVLEDLLETKKVIEELIRKYDNGSKIAFEKANNNSVYVNIENAEGIADLKEPLEMTFEEFVRRFKPVMVWHKNGTGTYSVPMGKYRFFAQNYKVVLIRMSVDRDAMKIAAKLSKNIYPISKYWRELMPLGFVLFVPN